MCSPDAQARNSLGEALSSRLRTLRSWTCTLPAPAERFELDLALVLDVAGLARDSVELQEVIDAGHALRPYHSLTHPRDPALGARTESRNLLRAVDSHRRARARARGALSGRA